MADISGFTCLTEQYQRHKEGVSGLTYLINGYISQICEQILKNGGDVLKFAGDAVLAFWDCEKESISQCVEDVITTALKIQEKNDRILTDVGIELRLKIAISAGHIVCSHIGTKGRIKHTVLKKIKGPILREVEVP